MNSDFILFYFKKSLARVTIGRKDFIYITYYLYPVFSPMGTKSNLLFPPTLLYPHNNLVKYVRACDGAKVT